MAQHTSYRIFDADQHFYEPDDSFTRYIDPKYRERTLFPVPQADGNHLWMADGRRTREDAHAPEMVYKPGSLKDLVRKVKKGGGDGEAYEWEPMRPEYRDRDRRLRLMDEQGVEAAFLYCNQAIQVDSYLRHDPELLFASLWAFNRWQEETWGYRYQNRIFTPVMLSLRDVDRAVELLDWGIAHGAAAVVFAPGPVAGRSPGDPHFDPVWARINEAGLTVGYHICETTHIEERSPEWGQEPFNTFYTQSAWQWMFCFGEQPLLETIAALIYDNLFGRFPDIKVLTAEYGVEWAPGFCRRLDKMRGMGRSGPWIGGPLPDRPSEIFKAHIRSVPYWEDDVEPVIAALGPDVIVGGSDFPHAEGLAEPSQLVEHVSHLSEEVQRAVMRENGMRLAGLA